MSILEELQTIAARSPTPVSDLAAALAHALGATHGPHTIELVYTDGRLERAYLKHGPIGTRDLNRTPESPPG